jgi:RNA polymerase sigma-70 factor (ECF subfamily)
LIDQVFRDEWGRVIAYLAGFLGDLDLAEEAAQEAFAIAAERWPREGEPSNPRAWLVTTARNRAIDHLRRDRAFAARAHLLISQTSTEDEVDETPIPDERLELLFACCHPSLATDAQVALTLRALGGLSTDEIARAFIVSPETMKRRLTRAKAKIRVAGIPLSVPPEHLLPQRLAAVLAIVYLIFNEGYGGRFDLSAEAIRLGRVLAQLMPDESEVFGLLALMLLHDSRRAARLVDGELVLLADQDRSLWDHEQIAAGRAALHRALTLRGRGQYALQAAIASQQAQDSPDWAEVVGLYTELVALTHSHVVALNRAVAIAQAGAPAAALELVDALDLEDYRYLHSTRAELLRRLDRREEAAAAYLRALALTATDSERRFLERRLAELAEPAEQAELAEPTEPDRRP